jgi:hypothetical protein
VTHASAAAHVVQSSQASVLHDREEDVLDGDGDGGGDGGGDDGGDGGGGGDGGAASATHAQS